MIKTIPLIEHLNSHKLSDTFSTIILYILSHRQKIPSMSISEVAEACFVSPATITRFCKNFQYSSFQELKNEINIENKTDATRLFSLSRSDLTAMNTNPKDSFFNYGQLIIEALEDTLKTIDISEIDTLINNIKNHQNVYLFGYSDGNHLAKKLQKGLLVSNKLTFAGNHFEQQVYLARKLKQEDLVIIISSFGNFFNNSNELFNELLNSEAKIILITQNNQLLVSPSFDNVICLNQINTQKAGNYPMNFFIDFLIKRYYQTQNNI